MGIQDKEVQEKYLEDIPVKKPLEVKTVEADNPDTKPFEKLFQLPQSIKDVKGSEVEIKELPFKKGWELTHKAYKLLKDLGSPDWGEIMGKLIELEDGDNRVLEITGIMLDMEPSKVGETFSFDRLVGTAIYFLAQIAQMQKSSEIVKETAQELIRDRLSLSKN